MGSPVYGQQYNVIPNNQIPLPPAYSRENLLTKDHGKHGAKAEAVKEFQDYVRSRESQRPMGPDDGEEIGCKHQLCEANNLAAANSRPGK